MPRASRHGGASEAAWSIIPSDSAGNTALVFTRAGSEFSVEPGMAGHRIGYRVRDGGLEVLYWPALDNAADAAPASYTLIRGIAGFRVSALRAGGTWVPQWPMLGEPDVPRAARIQLALADGTSIERLMVLR
jgi:type II secretion system protein J